MSNYEEMLKKHDYLFIKETNNLPQDYEGFYSDGTILIDRALSNARKYEILSEEIAHHKITYGDIVDPTKSLNRYLENKARRYSIEQIVPLDSLISAKTHGIHNLYELADFLGITECFAKQCLTHYKQKYGLLHTYKEHVIRFEPLQVYEYKYIHSKGVTE